MSEPTCDHPTAEDTPCQLPAGDNGRCWLPSHNPDGGGADSHGRDFAISESDHDAILDAARNGMSKAGCARAAGCDKASLLRYLESHESFRTAFKRARFEGEKRLIAGPLQSHEDSPEEWDSQHARFLLSTSFDYVKTEKRELEHSGKGIVINTTAGDDDE